MLNFIKENKKIVFLYFILLLSVPIMTIVLPHYYGQFIDDIKGGVSKENYKKTFYIIISLWILVVLMNYASNSLDSYFRPKLQGYVREKITKEIFERYKESYKEQEVGDLISKIIKLPFTIIDLFHEIKDYIMPIILMFGFSIIYFSIIHPLIGLITFFGILVFMGIISLFLKNCIEKANDADSYTDKVYEQISEMFENMSTIYSSDMCEGEMIRLKEFSDILLKKTSKSIQCSSNFNLLFNISYLILFFTICFFTFNLYKQKKIELKKMISVIIISLYIISYLSEATIEIRDFIYNLGILKKTQGFLDELNNRNEISNNKIKINRGIISVQNVELSYPNSNSSLFENLNVNINDGESVAIIGRIGSGKSSFVKMLLKFYPIQKGKIYIDNIDINDISSDSLRSQIMYIPQSPSLFNRTLYENISYGLNVSKKNVDELMRRLNAFRLFNDFNLDNNVGKRGEKLSGGQKQMVYLLRAILKNSKIIILDEPTSALDEESKSYILDILKKMMKDKTMLIITHDPSVLKYVDRTIIFHKGKIIS